MNQAFQISVQEKQGLPVVTITGFFGEEAGDRLLPMVQGFLSQGKAAVILDFTGCTVIASPGIGSLIEITGIAVTEMKRRIAFTGLDAFKIKVLSMVRVTELAQVAPTVNEALTLLRQR